MNRGRQDRRRDAPRRFASRRYEASAAFAAIVAWAHQTSSSNAVFAAPSRLASMSSMGLFAPIGEVDMKSPPPIFTVFVVDTMPNAIAMRRRCSTARLDEFIDESNPVRVIDMLVEALDLAEMSFEGVEPAATTGRPS
jgi:hypothetical protein